MERILAEIGRLRHETRVSFFEVDNRLSHVANDLKETRHELSKTATLMDEGFDLLLQSMKEVRGN